TTSELATIAMSILRERIDEFDLIVVDVNIPEMNCFEFMRSTQLIKDIPIVLMSSMINREMVEKAKEQGAYFILMKPISTKKLKNLWQYVYRHQIEASQKSKYEANNLVELMDSIDKEIQDKGFDAEEEQDHSLVLKNCTEEQVKTKQCMKWTPDLKKKFEEAVHNLGEKARPKYILELMNVPNLNRRQVKNYLQKYRVKNRQAQHVQQATSSIANQSKIMLRTPPPLVPTSHSQDGVNEGYHQLRFPREITTSLQECHEEKQPLNIESTDGNSSSMSQSLYIPDNGHYFNMLNHFLDNENPSSVLNSNNFPVKFNEPLQEAYLPQPPAVPSLVPPNDFFAGLNGLIQNLELELFNVLNSNELSMNFNEPLQEAYLPQPPAVPSLVPQSDLFTELKAPLSSNSTQDNVSTSDRKTKDEKSKHKRNSPSSPPPDEVKSKRQKIKGDEEPRKDKSRKEKQKPHKSKRHSNEEKELGEKHKSKSHKHKDKSKIKFEELSKDDYFSKNNEFATWLKDKKKLFFSDLSSEAARDLFSDFVKEWNKGKLDSQYYEGITTGPRSSHSWNIKK
ncbi:hypothetical protein HAX54_008791, partial [Datura stramonium]|nr:hypothetical protein [Datura stramonium]